MWSHFETALLTLLCQTTHDLLVPIESVSSWCLIARDTLKNSSFRSLPGGFVREVHLNIDVRRTGQPTSAPGSMTHEICLLWRQQGHEAVAEHDCEDEFVTQPACTFTTCATATHSLASRFRRRPGACHAPK